MNTEENVLDVIILGAGPAGLQAAIHASRRKVSVMVFGKLQKSAAQKAHITNFCCMDDTTSGDQLLKHGRNQAAASGTKFNEEDITAIEMDSEGRFQVEAESGNRYLSSSIVFAMGIARNRLNVPGEKEYIGKGVSYCVDCDGFFFKDQCVIIVGNESAAAAGALTLLAIAEEVHLVYQKTSFSQALKDRVSHSPIIQHPGRWIERIDGDSSVESVLIDDGNRISCSGVFIELGAKGAVQLAANLGILLDTERYPTIVVDRKQATNIPGAYAAGDICGSPWQVAKAVGEGCVAGLEAATFSKKRAARA